MFSLRQSIVAAGCTIATAAILISPIAAQAQESYAGNIVGGIAGALLGNQVGGGSGRVAATAVGGILGAIVGGNVERESQYRNQFTPAQQTYYDPYRQPATQYQRTYDPVTYQEPVYARPSYVQQSYAYVQTQPSYVYAQPVRGGWRNDADRRDYRDERHDRHREFDHDRWDDRRDRR